MPDRDQLTKNLNACLSIVPVITHRLAGLLWFSAAGCVLHSAA